MSKQERAALAKKHVEELEKSAAWDIHMCILCFMVDQMEIQQIL